MPPEHPTEDHLLPREQIVLPLRGRPLRDRYVLRLIALDRVVHFLVLAVFATAIFLFAQDRAHLHGTYTRILTALQGGLGGPIVNTHGGVFSEINRLFSLSSTELYEIGFAVAAYTAVLALEAFGLWFGKRWAEYLTLLETGVLVPFEIYELTTKVTALSVVTLLLILAVVVYLLLAKRLFGLRGGALAEQREREVDSGWTALETVAPYLD
jgi:uncharacterized membrane protein (DUF2068 family)